VIRFAWTRFRTQALVGAGVLAIVGAVLLWTGIQLNHAYYAAEAVCRQQGNCARMFTYTFPSQGYLDAGNELASAGLAAPALIGMFWGAPLAAREFETGTFRLAWTQGVTRTRWLAAKLAIAGVAAIAVGELFSLMVAWWASPIHKANPGYSELTSGSFHTGIAPAGYAAFAFALGVTAGLLIRHTLPAMAVTLAIYTAVIIVFPIWVRPHLIPPVQATVAFAPASAFSMLPPTGSTRTLQLQGGQTETPAGSWLLSTSQVVNQEGRPVYTVPGQACLGPSPSAPASPACTTYIKSLHLRQTVTYQPASRYWTFQWVETAIYLALALLLAGLCFLRIRPARSAERNSRSARSSPPVLALRR
jgi:ABC-2 family transporter protein